jgi:ribosomal protein S7
MSRRNISKKRFETDAIYNSYLVSLLITRILKSGKTKKIVYEVDIIKRKQMKIH